jgi:hypothetical protein
MLYTTGPLRPFKQRYIWNNSSWEGFSQTLCVSSDISPPSKLLRDCNIWHLLQTVWCIDVTLDLGLFFFLSLFMIIFTSLSFFLKFFFSIFLNFPFTCCYFLYFVIFFLIVFFLVLYFLRSFLIYLFYSVSVLFLHSSIRTDVCRSFPIFFIYIKLLKHMTYSLSVTIWMWTWA